MILQTVVLLVTLVLAGSALVCAVPRLRRTLLTRAIFRIYKSILPQKSETGRDALEAGAVWWEVMPIDYIIGGQVMAGQGILNSLSRPRSTRNRSRPECVLPK